MAKTKGIFMGSTFHGFKIPLKKPWKYFEKFTINGPWNSLDYKKCNEKHMKKTWFFLMTHEFDLLWDFHGVQEKAMKYIEITSWAGGACTGFSHELVMYQKSNKRA